MNKLYFLIGLPRSGKSFFAQKFLNYKINILNNNCYTENKPCCVLNLNPRAIVCADDIRLALGHRWNSYTEEFVNAIKIVMIRTLLKKHDVLVDGTHTTERSIRELLNIDKTAIPFVIRATCEECKKRAKATNQEDLYPIIDRMYNQLCSLDGDYGIYQTIDSWRDKTFLPEIRD
jgi:predicted kinase